jgi:hypothetical protein
LENLDLSEIAKQGEDKEATLTKICELLTDVKNGVNNIGTISDKQIDALFE